MLLAPRHLPRIAATVQLFTSYGLADFATQQGLDALPRDKDDRGSHAAQPSPELAAAFRRKLVELGPAYIKLGQVLATRPDLLPDIYIEELQKLQDDVAPIDVAEVMQVIEEELGGRMNKLFEHFDLEPLGTASLGQVHAATIRGGREVVVKVQRPGIRGPLADDIAFFREMAEFLTAHTGVGRRVDLLGVIQQLQRALADELDYRIEARNTAHFRRALAPFPRLLVPQVIEGYSSERVLTTERVRGVKIGDISPLTRMERDLTSVAEDLTRGYLRQITIDGHFHADPHPGNVFLTLPTEPNPSTPSHIATVERPGRMMATTPLARLEVDARREAAREPADVDVRLALIDFGMTARLSVRARELCVRILLGLADDRGNDVADGLIELGEPTDGFDRAAFGREIESVVARHSGLEIGSLNTGKLLYEMINISFQRGLRLPAEMTLLAKALVNLDEVTRALDPGYDPVSAVREYMNEIASDRAKKRLNPRHLYRVATESADLLAALPHRLDLISARMANGEFETRLDVPQIGVLLKGLQKVANRVFTGLVLAGLLVASAMLMPYRGGLGTAGFIIAGALGLYMVLSILWSDRESRAKVSS